MSEIIKTHPIVIKEGVGTFCPICGSTMSKTGFLRLWGNRKCDNKYCSEVINLKRIKMRKLDKSKVYDLSELTKEERKELFKEIKRAEGNYHLMLHDGEDWLLYVEKTEFKIPTTNAKELFYTLENVQVDCRGLTYDQIDEMLSVVDDKLDPLNSSFDVDKECIYFSFNKYCKLFGFYGIDEEQYKITYEKFMELFGNKEKSVEFDLLGYSVEVDNEDQARMLQESAFKQGFRWIGGGEKILHTSKKYFQFKGKTIYWKNEHPDNLKRIHYNNIFAPKYEVTMMDEKPKEFQNLLNEESYKEIKPQHYSKVTDTFARMEANCTIEECLAFAKGNIDSYNWSTKEQSKENFEKIISYASWAVKLLQMENN